MLSCEVTALPLVLHRREILEFQMFKFTLSILMTPLTVLVAGQNIEHISSNSVVVANKRLRRSKSSPMLSEVSCDWWPRGEKSCCLALERHLQSIKRSSVLCK